MSKPRHRAPSATVRQRLLWTIAAVVTPLLTMLLTAQSDGRIAQFGALLACFATGTLAAEFLLGRPARGFVASTSNTVANTRGTRRSAPAQPRALPAAPASGPTPARQQRDERTSVPFGTGHTAGGLLEITLLTAANSAHDPGSTEDPRTVPTLLRADERPLSSSAADAVEPRPRDTEQYRAMSQALLQNRTTASEPAPHEQSTLDTKDAPIPIQQNEDQGPFPGAVRAGSDGRSPGKSYRVKGNSRSKLYHTMQSPYYERTKATVWFKTAAEAERAGFSPWNRRSQNDN